MFFAFGIGSGLWGGASGAILIRVGVDAATFGVLLTVYIGAYLIAMSAGGAVAHRFGVEQALSVSAIIFGATLCALLNASSEAWVAIALIVAGFLGGVVDILMNAEGARIERRLGRPILARLHAAASAGMALGAILGSLIAASFGASSRNSSVDHNDAASSAAIETPTTTPSPIRAGANDNPLRPHAPTGAGAGESVRAAR